MSHRGTQPTTNPSRRPPSGSNRQQARILQQKRRPETPMSSLRLSSPATASTGGRRSVRSVPPGSSDPPSRDSVAPASGRPASSVAPLDYTDEQEETRVRATSSARSSEAPESAASEELQESGDAFPVEVESSPDSMLSRYFRDMAT